MLSRRAMVAIASKDLGTQTLNADSDDVNGLFRRDVNKVGAKRRW